MKQGTSDTLTEPQEPRGGLEVQIWSHPVVVNIASATSVRDVIERLEALVRWDKRIARNMSVVVNSPNPAIVHKVFSYFKELIEELMGELQVEKGFLEVTYDLEKTPAEIVVKERQP